MPNLRPEVVAHYVELLQHPGGAFGQAACVTVVPGGRDLDEVLETIGVITRREGAMDVDGEGGRRGSSDHQVLVSASQV